MKHSGMRGGPCSRTGALPVGFLNSSGARVRAEQQQCTMETEYTTREPARAEVDAMTGAAVIEFGTGWCGYCRRAAPFVAEALGAHGHVRHIKIEDGSGRRLGRTFNVKLWPTLIFLRDGVEVARLVRPGGTGEIRDALAKIV